MTRRLALLALTLITSLSIAKSEEAKDATPTVRLKTSMGDILIELNREKAPVTVENFLQYVEKKHYDGTIFHRVIPNFMIQGGGFFNFKGKLVEKQTDKPIVNESNNGLLNEHGTIAMARTRDPDSATAQFFINVKNNDSLNYPSMGGYTVFGRVIEGMDVVDKIRQTDTAFRDIIGIKKSTGEQIIMPARDVPRKDVTILTATVEETDSAIIPQEQPEAVEVDSKTTVMLEDLDARSMQTISCYRRPTSPLWIVPLLAFLMGSIPFGFIFGKIKGIDIREHGSGNIGATNVWRILGKQFGIPCLILDALKGLIPTILAITWIRFEGQSEAMAIGPLLPYSYIFPADQQFTAQALVVFCGLLSILGHNYSPWVRFKGGKGIATSAGVVIALMPAAIVLLLAFWFFLFVTTRYVSIASIGASAMLPIITFGGSWYHGRIQDGTWNKPLFIFSLVIGLLAIWKHRTNIKRLLDGTENRFSRKSKDRS